MYIVHIVLGARGQQCQEQGLRLEVVYGSVGSKLGLCTRVKQARAARAGPSQGGWRGGFGGV